MKKISLIIALLVSVINFANAQGSHYVQGHYRSNGTYVEGYYKTNPNSTINDNWSTYPNVNPYTGKTGTVKPDYIQSLYNNTNSDKKSYQELLNSLNTYTPQTYSTPTYYTPTTYTKSTYSNSNSYTAPTYKVVYRYYR